MTERMEARVDEWRRVKLWPHPGRRDLRAGEPHVVEGAAYQPRGLCVLDEGAHIDERLRMPLRHRDRGGGIEKAAVEHARTRDLRRQAGQRLAAERDCVCLARTHGGDRGV